MVAQCVPIWQNSATNAAMVPNVCFLAIFEGFLSCVLYFSKNFLCKTMQFSKKIAARVLLYIFFGGLPKRSHSGGKDVVTVTVFQNWRHFATIAVVLASRQVSHSNLRLTARCKRGVQMANILTLSLGRSWA